MHFLLRHRPVLDTARDDEQLARTERHALVTQVDPEPPLEHQEEVVRLVVFVPDELTLQLHDHDVVAIVEGDGAWLIELRERRQLVGELDRLHGLLPYQANRFSDRSFAFRASSSRLRGAALVWSESISRWAASVTSSTARLKAASFAREGRAVPLSLRTNWSADARISSSVAGGSKLASVLMFLHMLVVPVSPSA